MPLAMSPFKAASCRWRNASDPVHQRNNSDCSSGPSSAAASLIFSTALIRGEYHSAIVFVHQSPDGETKNGWDARPHPGLLRPAAQRRRRGIGVERHPQKDEGPVRGGMVAVARTGRCHSYGALDRILNTTFVLSGTPLVNVTVTGVDTRLENERVRVMNPL